MHQDHNIPWHILAANLKFVRDNAQFTPRKTDIFEQGLPNQSQQLDHFARCLQATITQFSDTERSKYPEKMPDLPLDAKLFPDELLEKHKEHLKKRHQLLQYWVDSRQKIPESEDLTYTTSNGELADVVKVLVYENEMGALLTLAQHSDVPLGALKHLSWGHHFGFSRIAEAALSSYIFINTIDAMDLLVKGEYKECYSYNHLERYLTMGMDFDAQQLPHWEFFGRSARKEPFDLTADMNKLKEYLKELFRQLYRYDMLTRECGRSPEWEDEVMSTLVDTIHWRIETDYVGIPNSEGVVTYQRRFK